MSIRESLRAIAIRPYRVAYEARLKLLIYWLNALNRYGRRAITVKGGPAVSLTTYGGRINTVYLTIESIARGSVRPSRIILWIDDESIFQNLPATVRRQQRRGLEVRLSCNYGPHTKYYPYLEFQEEFIVPLVTADDDMLYPRAWLSDLVAAYEHYPAYINCHLAKVVACDDSGLARYAAWVGCDSTEPSFRYVALGVAGVIYPPRFLRTVKASGTEFERCCPKADDLWLHVQALRAGFKIRQIRGRARRVPQIPGTQEMALWHENYQSGNDLQAKATYTLKDIGIMRTEVALPQAMSV